MTTTGATCGRRLPTTSASAARRSGSGFGRASSRSRMPRMPSLLAALALGYLSGSLPWGLWLPRAWKGVDVRTLGSRNLGATNVYRTLGPAIGIPVLLLDIAKGALPTWLVPGPALGATLPGGREGGVSGGGGVGPARGRARRGARPRVHGVRGLQGGEGRRHHRRRAARALATGLWSLRGGVRRHGGAHPVHLARLDPRLGRVRDHARARRPGRAPEPDVRGRRRDRAPRDRPPQGQHRAARARRGAAVLVPSR